MNTSPDSNVQTPPETHDSITNSRPIDRNLRRHVLQQVLNELKIVRHPEDITSHVEIIDKHLVDAIGKRVDFAEEIAKTDTANNVQVFLERLANRSTLQAMQEELDDLKQISEKNYNLISPFAEDYIERIKSAMKGHEANITL